ncbi:polyphosphate kinase 2 family protein [Flavobacterium sp. MAH-1]|uniref:Polyphosphate kinase 2 family protein n=1 Tax=Flavobacterium agri TaxID=2743471 RepID=A0A7Y9C786_9FLAO|nr:PPK2 family polyphosphate kinase [Flavobacterium agri]NUY81078.1 polyphosphate kinase 2 family protein [Flavobacterium agri]NYA71102.1 polyphosphate kinase 2 family protein [Flavobacterium agri]
MKDISASDFRVTSSVQLSAIPTVFDLKSDEDATEEALAEIRDDLSKIQDKMYAHNKYGVLICLQGMDTSGKDSLIREVFKEINPRGVVVHSFKTPNSTELEHDYLWRHYLALPEKGKMAVFNRTHYENVLVTRVHPEYILNENIPGIGSVGDIDEKFWEHRMESINQFEKHISRNGVIVLKFFLHLSKEEQRERLLRRLEEEKHNWKFSPGDLKERALWDKYRECYQLAINATSKENAPWFVIPADDKASARYIVAKIILDELKKYKDIQHPELEDEVKENMTSFRKQLESEK